MRAVNRALIVVLLVAGACRSKESSPLPATAPPVEAEQVIVAPQSPRENLPVPAIVTRKMSLRTIVQGLNRPVGVEVPPGEPVPSAHGRLFVVEQHTGRIVIVVDGKVRARPFLDLGKQISRGNEQGLLGLAFHPQFPNAGVFYVNYTDRRGTTRIVEYQVASNDKNRADTTTAREILHIPQPFANHNGGGLEFGGPGQYLYIGTGDGGAGGDPKGHGQNKTSLLGKMLRIDVATGEPKPEIIQWGLRNPWRFHFDVESSALYIADVGQEQWEEVNVVAFADIEGKNFGWNEMEGNHCYRPTKGCNKDRFTQPVVEYNHKKGCSITGGEVYRGKRLPKLRGMYFYADFCTAMVRSFVWSANKGVAKHSEWKLTADPPLAHVSSFGSDSEGELYMVSLDGEIYTFANETAN